MASAASLQEMRGEIDAALSSAAARSPTARPPAGGGTTGTVASASLGDDFCSLWPEAKPILEAIGGIIGIIPGLGTGAGAILKALTSLGDQIYGSTCNK